MQIHFDPFLETISKTGSNQPESAENFKHTDYMTCNIHFLRMLLAAVIIGTLKGSQYLLRNMRDVSPPLRLKTNLEILILT